MLQSNKDVIAGLGSILCLALLPAVAFSADGDLSRLKTEYDCQEKAAEFTKNMGKPGDTTLYNEHYSQCIKLAPQATAKPKVKMQASCDPLEHPFKFVNNSGETLWIGVWEDAPNNGGVAPTASWPKWRLDDKKDGSWCAPEHFQGRFIIRAKCNETTGICDEGNCRTASNSTDMICNAGAQPASLAEFNFDSNIDNKVSPQGVTWYDVSYVDGYNFPIQIISNDNKKCSDLGSLSMPPCPWPTINGVCLAPYKQFELDVPSSYKFEQGWYTMAAKCAYQGTKELCGCGNQCTAEQKAKKLLDPCETTYSTTPAVHPKTGLPVILNSAGCSPYNKYNDNRANAQIVCDPMKPKPAGSNCLEWPSAPQNYKSYAVNIHAVVPKAYTWQYHDEDSLTNCATQKGEGYTITIGPRPVSTAAYAVEFHPGKMASGKIAVGTPPAITEFKANSDKLTLTMKDKDNVTITSNCDNNEVLSCTGSYNATYGIIYTPKANDTSDCNDPMSNLGWAPQTGSTKMTTFQMDKPASPLVCKPAGINIRKFTLTPNGVSGNVVITPNISAPQQTVTLTAGQNQTFFLDHGYKVNIKTTCSDNKTQLSCNAVYDAAVGLLSTDPANSVCNDRSKSGYSWSVNDGSKQDLRGLGLAPPTDAACFNFQIYAGDGFSAKLWKNGIRLDDVGGTPYKLNLSDSDKILLDTRCSGSKRISCTATFNASSGYLVPDSNKCKKTDILGWTIKPNELHPGIPADDLCDQ